MNIKKIKLLWRSTPVFGIFMLILYVLSPTLTGDLGINNWFIFPASGGVFSYYFTLLIAITFIWLFLFFLIEVSVSRKIQYLSDPSIKHESRNILISERDRTEYPGHWFRLLEISSLFLSLVFGLQLVVLNDSLGSAAFLMLIAIWFALYMVLKKVINSRGNIPGFFIDKLEQMHNKVGGESLTQRFKEEYKSRNPLMLQDIPKLYTEHNNEQLDALKKTSLASDSEAISRVEAYEIFIVSLGTISFIIFALTCLILTFTSPSFAGHGHLPVIFFITLILLEVLYIWHLILKWHISGPAIKAIYGLISNLGKTVFSYWKVNATLIVALIACAALLISAVQYIFMDNKEDTTTSKHKHKYIHEAHNSLSETVNHDQSPIVIVTASGGGIAASAWTASVMRRIEATQPEIFNNIRSISSVSGGSLGAYYVIAKELVIRDCKNKFIANEFDCRKRVNNELKEFEGDSHQLASRSSLGAVAWGVSAYETSSILPFFNKGRDHALIERWEKVFCNSPKKNYLENSLYSLADRINLNTGQNDDSKKQASFNENFDACESLKKYLKGNFRDWHNNQNNIPSFLVNAATESTGLRVVLSTDTSFGGIESKNKNSLLKYLSANSVGCLEAVPVSQAVKHSSTFPYITPPSLLSPLKQNYREGCSNLSSSYLVDGGYVDNHGLHTAVEYIKHLSDEKILKPGQGVILVRINAYPTNKYINGSDKRVSLLREITSPLIAIEKTRANQMHLGEKYIESLEKDLENSKNWIESIKFDYPSKKSLPLSWHLSEKEKNAVFKTLKINELLDRKKNQTKATLDTNINCKNVNETRDIEYKFQCLEHFFNIKASAQEPKSPSLLSQNNAMLKDLVGFKNKFVTGMNWKNFVRSEGFCSLSQHPKLISISPLYKSKESSGGKITYLPNSACDASKSDKICTLNQKNNIYIIAFASQEGRHGYNFSLSEARASTLREDLIKQGVLESKIHVVARGELNKIKYPIKFNDEQKVYLKTDPHRQFRYAFSFTCE